MFNTGTTVKFAEAVLWFRRRVPMTDKEFATLTAAAKEKAFLVAGVTQLDVVTEVWDALEKAVSAGTTLQDFRKAIGERLTKQWGGENPYRLETIFRTNIQKAYSSGRHHQMTDPVILRERPIWEYDAIFDSRTSSICKECNQVKRPADDPWWKTHTPPLHFSCRSAITPMTEEQAKANGGLSKAPGATPDGGFGHAPGTAPEWKPSKKDYPASLWNAYTRAHRSAPKGERATTARAG